MKEEPSPSMVTATVKVVSLSTNECPAIRSREEDSLESAINTRTRNKTRATIPPIKTIDPTDDETIKSAEVP
jgi:hypothetical protein